MGNGASLSELIGIIGRRRGAKDESIEGIHGVHMQVTEISVALGAIASGSGWCRISGLHRLRR